MTPEKRLQTTRMVCGSGGLESAAVMSYSRYRTPARRASAGQLAPMGDAWDDVKSLSSAIDPYLPEVLCRIDQLRALRSGRSVLDVMMFQPPTGPVPACVTTPPGITGGIGVVRAINPLRAGVWAYMNPGGVWLGIAVVLGVPFLIGYSMGTHN